MQLAGYLLSSHSAKGVALHGTEMKEAAAVVGTRGLVGSTSFVPATKQMIQPEAAIAGPTRARDAAELLPWLPCVLALEVPVVGFTVGSLLKLRSGSLVQTSCHQSSDIPLQVNGVLMAWTEFEVVGERLAARITDMV